NAVLTHTGAREGLLMTAGFESPVHMARTNKVLGLVDDELRDPSKWSKPAQVVARRDIRGLRERIDADGAVRVALDERHAAAQIRSLVDDGCESLAVCLLWSCFNPVHERRLRELVEQERPGIPVTISADLSPSPGEYERAVAATVNAYLGPLMQDYLDRLLAALRDRRFAGELVIVGSDGALKAMSEARDLPVTTLSSGPVAGLMASQDLAARLGSRRLMATDVGGTSFDVGLVLDHELPMSARPMINRNTVNLEMVEVRSIGTGGGSIAWIDEDLGSLRVGPQSAGASPGPACYGRGGEEPTLTDAIAVLGYVDTLVGGLQLDRSLATKAVRTRLAEPLGLEVVRAAQGVLTVAASQMADLMSRTAHQRGHAVQEFTVAAYGGAAAQYAGLYARALGVAEVVIPVLASVFSAHGTTVGGRRSVAVRRYRPAPLTDRIGEVPQIVAELEREARAMAHKIDPNFDEPTLRHTCRLRFAGQIKDLSIVVERAALVEGDLEAIGRTYRSAYETLVGPRAAAVDSAIELVELAVEASVPLASRSDGLRVTLGSGGDVATERRAWFDGEELVCPVMTWADLSEVPVAGPAFVVLPTTTVVVYPGQLVRLAPTGDIVLVA
ncbi:MAG: hydantoinase/oxoprolinase family protein, partial [Acidimicrobiia bacterium]